MAKAKGAGRNPMGTGKKVDIERVLSEAGGDDSFKKLGGSGGPAPKTTLPDPVD